eukprot:scaffold1852_cov123-Skeletonema_marinoi.AAC.5
MMQADDDVYNVQASETSPSQRRRISSIKKAKLELVSLLPNLGSLLLFYVCFYSFLIGFYLLLLQGVTSTSVGEQQTLLWTFFYLGIAFVFVVSVTTYASQWEKKTASSSGSSKGSSASESESSALLKEPPPPPAAVGDSHRSRGTATDDDLDDIELVSDVNSTVTDDTRYIGDVEVS